MADYRRHYDWTRRRDLLVDVIQGEAMLNRRAAHVADRISDVADVTNLLRTRIGYGHDWARDFSRASGLGNTSSQHVIEASGNRTPSKSTSGTSA
jgi:hypothetical protein